VDDSTRSRDFESHWDFRVCPDFCVVLLEHAAEIHNLRVGNENALLRKEILDALLKINLECRNREPLHFLGKGFV
jgi:hypothetical protein